MASRCGVPQGRDAEIRCTFASLHGCTADVARPIPRSGDCGSREEDRGSEDSSLCQGFNSMRCRDLLSALRAQLPRARQRTARVQPPNVESNSRRAARRRSSPSSFSRRFPPNAPTASLHRPCHLDIGYPIPHGAAYSPRGTPVQTRCSRRAAEDQDAADSSSYVVQTTSCELLSPPTTAQVTLAPNSTATLAKAHVLLPFPRPSL